MAIKLFHFPGACSRVTMHALEELGVEYDDHFVNLFAGEHKKPEYLAVNQQGKVPALAIDDQVLTENSAILWTLHSHFGGDRLFPENPATALASHPYRSDLAWCSATFHPMVRQVRMPVRFTSGDQDGVRADGIDKLNHECEHIAARIGGGWWYGDRWSILDTYVFWGLETARTGGFALDRFPALVAHAERLLALPAMQRALAREKAALDRAGVSFP